jgi:hypothetical protein
MGWTKNEPVTITFGTLKQTQNESFQQGIAFVKSQIWRFVSEDANRDTIISFIDLLKNETLYYEGGEEECDCEEDCGVDGCEAPVSEESCCCECEELK